MSVFWLTPVTCEDPFTLGKQRLRCEGETFAAFRTKVQKMTSPRHLLAFKSSLLLSDDEDLCGSDDEWTVVNLANGDDLVFSGDSLTLSHCAEAFVAKLPDAKEWRAWFASLKGTSVAWDATETAWLATMERWVQEHYGIVLLKED